MNAYKSLLLCLLLFFAYSTQAAVINITNVNCNGPDLTFKIVGNDNKCTTQSFKLDPSKSLPQSVKSSFNTCYQAKCIKVYCRYKIIHNQFMSTDFKVGDDETRQVNCRNNALTFY